MARGKRIEYKEEESSDDELSRLELDALEEYEGEDDGNRVVVDKGVGSLTVTIAFSNTAKFAEFNVKKERKKPGRPKKNSDSVSTSGSATPTSSAVKRGNKKKVSLDDSESLDADEDEDDDEDEVEDVDEDGEDEDMNLDLELEDDEGDVIAVDYDDEDEDDEDLFDYDEEDRKNVDMSKLSDRQRAKYFGQSEEPEDLQSQYYQGKKLPKSVLALMEGSKKKQLTEEEIEFRKADAARKRKNFVMKKLEEEKKETLRKLLYRKVEKVDSKKQEEENERQRLQKLKRAELIKHKALFSWVSKTDGEGDQRQAVSYYSMQ